MTHIMFLSENLLALIYISLAQGVGLWDFSWPEHHSIGCCTLLYEKKVHTLVDLKMIFRQRLVQDGILPTHARNIIFKSTCVRTYYSRQHACSKCTERWWHIIIHIYRNMIEHSSVRPWTPFLQDYLSQWQVRRNYWHRSRRRHLQYYKRMLHNSQVSKGTQFQMTPHGKIYFADHDFFYDLILAEQNKVVGSDGRLAKVEKNCYI
jgi:hypothetical protein